MPVYQLAQSARLSTSIKKNRARILRHLNKLPSKRLWEWPGYLAGRVVAIGRRVEHIVWRRAYRLYVNLAGRKKTATSATEPGGSRPSPFQDLWRVYHAMGLAYKPSPYRGNVVLFRATEPSRDGNYGPSDLGWTPLTAKRPRDRQDPGRPSVDAARTEHRGSRRRNDAMAVAV